MLDLEKLRTYTKTVKSPTQGARLTLSPDAHGILRAAWLYSGVSMSELVNMLILEHIPDRRADSEPAESTDTDHRVDDTAYEDGNSH